MVRGSVSPYKGLGIVLSLTGSTLAIYTYLFQGLGPLAAFWLGLAIVGFSIILSREDPAVRREMSGIIESSLAAISIVLELLNIGSKTVFRYISGRGVYIYIGGEPPPGDPGGAAVYRGRDGYILAIKSPFSYLVEHISSDLGGWAVEDILDRIAVESLEIADSVKCVEEPSRVICRLSGAFAPTPGRIREAVGDIYAMLTATVVSAIRRADVEIEINKRDGDSVVVGLRIYGGG